MCLVRVSAKHPFQFKVDYAWTLDWPLSNAFPVAADQPLHLDPRSSLKYLPATTSRKMRPLLRSWRDLNMWSLKRRTFLRVCEVFQDSWWAGHWKPSKNKSCDSQEEPDDDEDKPKKRAKPKASLLEEAEDCWQVGSDLSDIFLIFNVEVFPWFLCGCFCALCFCFLSLCVYVSLFFSFPAFLLLFVLAFMFVCFLLVGIFCSLASFPIFLSIKACTTINNQQPTTTKLTINTKQRTATTRTWSTMTTTRKKYVSTGS